MVDETHTAFTVTLEASVTTGTVTVTAIDNEQTPVMDSSIVLVTGQYTSVAEALAAVQEDKTICAGIGVTDSNGETVLYKANPETLEPTSTVADIAFGTYTLFGVETVQQLQYIDNAFVVDGDETVTITLTSG